MTTPCPCISYFCIPLSIFLSPPSLSLFFCLSLSYIAIFLYFCNYITFILSICLSLSLFLLYPTGHSIFLWCLGSFQILYIFQPIGPTQHPLLSWLLTYRLYIYKDSTTFQKSLHPTGQFSDSLYFPTHWTNTASSFHGYWHIDIIDSKTFGFSNICIMYMFKFYELYRIPGRNICLSLNVK